MQSESTLSRRYTLEREIGRSGFCVTWIGHPKKSREPKLIFKELQLDLLHGITPDEFEAQAQILSNLHHDHIPDFVDYFSEEDEAKGKRLFLVQEYIPGSDVATLMAKGRLFTEAEVIKIARQMAEVLVFLHGFSPSIIHRDIKPANILLRKGDEHVYLIEFGAVKAPNPDIGSGLTVTGTFGYMPQEQIEGKEVPASDLYALGLTLIQMLSQHDPTRLPKQGHKLSFRHLVNIGDGFARVLERLVEPDLRRRTPSAAELLKALDKLEQPAKAKLPPWKPALGIAAALVLIGWLSVEELPHRLKPRQAAIPASATPTATPESYAYGLSPDQALSLADKAYNAAEYTEAVKYYDLALRSYPKRAELWFNRAYSHSMLEQDREAISDYEQALKIDPNIYPETTHHNLGIKYYNAGEYDKAKTEFLAQLALRPQHKSALNYLGLVYFETKHKDQALKLYNQVIALDPQYKYPYNNRGELYLEQGQIDQALIDFDKAIALDPAYALPHYNKAELYYDQNRYLLCINEATRAIELSQTYATAHNIRGLCQLGLSHYAEAIAEFKQAQTESPAYAAAAFNLGLVYDTQKQFPQAISAYEQALKLQADYDKPLENLGYIYERLGKPDQAMSYYTQAIQANPLPVYYLNRGNLARDTGHCPQAQADWKQACSKGYKDACNAVCE